MSENKRAENCVSMKEITQYLDVIRETVLQWIGNRNMPASKVKGLWKFKKSEVEKWIHSGDAADKNG